MKKVLFLLSATIMMAACSKQESIENDSASPVKQESKLGIRSYEEALKIAESSIPMIDSKESTRGLIDYRKIDYKDKQAYIYDFKTRANTNLNDTLIYVINFENNKGFALISAAKNTEGLLAITEKGHCNVNERSNNPGFEMFIKLAKEYVTNAYKRLFRDPSDTLISINVVETDVNTVVGPYISTKWGKFHPEGEEFNNNDAGCTNVAMVQIMSYYNYPTQIDLTYNNSGMLNLNWNAMKTHYLGYHFVSDCGDSTTHSMISKLIRQIAEHNHSNDSSNETTTNTFTYAGPTFSILGYNTSNWENYGKTFIQNQLNMNHLILIKGHDPDSPSSSGHTWALDGYKILGTISYFYKKIGNGPWVLDEIVDGTIHYNHFNWGYYGSNNGYFSDNVFNLQSYYELDTGDHYCYGILGYNVLLMSAYR